MSDIGHLHVAHQTSTDVHIMYFLIFRRNALENGHWAEPNVSVVPWLNNLSHNDETKRQWKSHVITRNYKIKFQIHKTAKNKLNVNRRREEGQGVASQSKHLTWDILLTCDVKLDEYSFLYLIWNYGSTFGWSWLNLVKYLLHSNQHILMALCPHYEITNLNRRGPATIFLKLGLCEFYLGLRLGALKDHVRINK